MLRMTLRHIGVYRHAERYRQTAEHTFLGFTVSGLVYAHQPDADLDARSGPFFSLLLKGEVTDFEFGADRENWVVQLDTDDLRADPARRASVLARQGATWVPLPRYVFVPRERVPGWREECRRIREAFASPVPRERLRAELGVLGLFRVFLDSEAGTLSVSPAQELKRLIDEDVEFARTLDQLSRRVGYSADHLRKLFEGEFQTSPQEYRSQRRLALVMDLVANSRLSVKEIAARAGFRHVSHLSAAFRHSLGICPREGIRRYRYGAADAGSPK